MEPWFLGGGKDSPAGEEFAAVVDDWSDVNFGASLGASTWSTATEGPKMALIAGRTADNPGFFREAIACGATHVLSRDGAFFRGAFHRACHVERRTHRPLESARASGERSRSDDSLEGRESERMTLGRTSRASQRASVEGVSARSEVFVSLAPRGGHRWLARSLDRALLFQAREARRADGGGARGHVGAREREADPRLHGVH